MTEKITHIDPDLTVTLPLSLWQVVMRQLGRGPFDEVGMSIYRIGEQATPQLVAAQAAAVASPPHEPAAEISPQARGLH
jgi:hypothetical protein